MRVCVLAMRVIDNVSDKRMQLTYLEGFAAKTAVMQVGDSEHGDGDGSRQRRGPCLVARHGQAVTTVIIQSTTQISSPSFGRNSVLNIG